MYMHCHAIYICQLPSCNLFTQHVIYHGETPLVNCGPRSFLLHTEYNIYCNTLFTVPATPTVFVTPLPGTYHQRGGRPVRQPKISGRTSRQCNIMEIITQSGTRSATNGLQGHQGMTKYQAKHGSDTEF